MCLKYCTIEYSHKSKENIDMIIGYARVSSQNLSLDLQLNKLKEAGCEKIYHENVSGAKENRREHK